MITCIVTINDGLIDSVNEDMKYIIKTMSGVSNFDQIGDNIYLSAMSIRAYEALSTLAAADCFKITRLYI